jgi:uncharacterized protein (DUF2147 family)
MRHFIRPAAALLIAFSWLAVPSGGARAETATPTPAQIQAAAPNGLWATADHGGVIQIASCGQDLCGQIVGMVLGPQDPTPKDWAGATQCRLTILQAAPQVDGNGQLSWSGTIVNPRNGSTYNIILRVNSQHQLLLRGYLGLPIFGQTQTWSPFNGTLAENCRINQPVG